MINSQDENTVFIGPRLTSLELESDELSSKESISAREHSAKSSSYYDRKLEGRLRKYEIYLKNHENINRVNNENQVIHEIKNDENKNQRLTNQPSYLEINSFLLLCIKFLFVGNGGLENNISSSFLYETFGQFGHVIDVIMPKKRSYAFVIYAEGEASSRAIQKLQGQVITRNQTPICFYMFNVDRGKIIYI